MAVRAIRGATTAEENTREAIIDATLELLGVIEEKNDLKRADAISIIFTVTSDLTAVFPAAAAREMGLTFVPLLDMAAPAIDGSLEKCIPRSSALINVSLRFGKPLCRKLTVKSMIILLKKCCAPVQQIFPPLI